MERSIRILALAALAAATGATTGAAYAAADAEHGKQLYQERCTACHSVQYNGVGPAHQGVYGRHAGRAPGFDYSAAVRGSDVTWNDTTLDQWLTDPEKLIPGQKMGFMVPEAADRADLIAYLKTLTK